MWFFTASSNAAWKRSDPFMATDLRRSSVMDSVVLPVSFPAQDEPTVNQRQIDRGYNSLPFRGLVEGRRSLGMS